MAALEKNKVKAIIFDCFGVFYTDQFTMFIQNSAPELREDLRNIMLAYDLGDLEQTEVVERYSKITKISQQEVSAYLFAGGLVRDQALLDYSQQLRKKYKIGLLSNASPGSMERHFTDAERPKYFDAVIVSCEVDLIKPWSEIFLLTAERLGVAPQEAIFVDDSSINCDGARKVGMQAIWYRGLDKLQEELAVILN